MNKDYGLVSIVTPCFNGERFIAETICSVQSQTYTNWEMLIQDDGSTDNSVRIAESFAANDNRIKIEKNIGNLGAAITRNNAIKRSKGQWIAFLDCDDIWMPNKLQFQLDWMVEHRSSFSYMEYEHMAENGAFIGCRAMVKKKLTYNDLLRHCWPGCLTVLYKQDLRNKIFSENICNNEDHALFLRVIKHFGNADGISSCLSLYRIRKGSLSRNKFKLIKPYFDTIHELEGNRWLMSAICVFTHVIIKIFIKYKKITIDQSLIPKYKSYNWGGVTY